MKSLILCEDHLHHGHLTCDPTGLSFWNVDAIMHVAAPQLIPSIEVTFASTNSLKGGQITFSGHSRDNTSVATCVNSDQYSVKDNNYKFVILFYQLPIDGNLKISCFL